MRRINYRVLVVCWLLFHLSTYFLQWEFYSMRPPTQHGLYLARGTLQYLRMTSPGYTEPETQFHMHVTGKWLGRGSGSAYRFIGFAYEDYTFGLGTTLRIVQFNVPFWPVSLMLVALWAVRSMKKAPGIGFCTSCGYDVRAHKKGDRCPECGAVVSA